MSAQWPPPPDLESIQELVRNADVEGLIEIHGAPPDEYEPEGEKIFGAISDLPTTKITALELLPVLDRVWQTSFVADEAELALRRPALLKLAGQIERFFGPGSEPQTR